MSYDLQVWTKQRPDLPRCLPRPRSWLPEAGAFFRRGATWQLVVDEPLEAMPEDVPAGIRMHFPDAAFLTYLSLEPGSAGFLARRFAHVTSAAIAKDVENQALPLRKG